MWSDLDLTDAVANILRDVHLNNPRGHHFGRPYITAYQIAIELEIRYLEVFEVIGKQIGGKGTGEHTSVTQYIANQLSKRINADPSGFPVEGIFMSNENVMDMLFTRSDGTLIQSSLAGTASDIALYRFAD